MPIFPNKTSEDYRVNPDGSIYAEQQYKLDAEGSMTTFSWRQGNDSALVYRQRDNDAPELVEAVFDLPEGFYSPSPQRLPISQASFMDLAVEAFGGGIPGAIRYDVLWQAVEASTEPAVPFALKKFTIAQALEYDQVAEFLNLFVAYGLGGFTQAECDAILASWPQGNL